MHFVPIKTVEQQSGLMLDRDTHFFVGAKAGANWH